MISYLTTSKCIEKFLKSCNLVMSIHKMTINYAEVNKLSQNIPNRKIIVPQNIYHIFNIWPFLPVANKPQKFIEKTFFKTIEWKDDIILYWPYIICLLNNVSPINVYSKFHFSCTQFRNIKYFFRAQTNVVSSKFKMDINRQINVSCMWHLSNH